MVFTPLAGEIIIYDDYFEVTEEGAVKKKVPGVKIGTGNTFLVDIPFCNAQESQEIADHIKDQIRHIVQEERTT